MTTVGVRWDPSTLALDVPAGTIQSVVIDGDDYVVIRHLNGWTLLPDRCSHSGCAFSKFGEVVDANVLICNCHGAEFDAITGEVMMGPAQEAVAALPLQVVDGAFHLPDALVPTPTLLPAPAIDVPSRQGSTGTTLVADISLCKGYANCVVAADDYLDLDDEGIVVLLHTSVPEADRPRLEAAVRSCPVAALQLEPCE